MHFRTLIAVKAEHKKDAQMRVEQFLEDYQGEAFDWYAIDDGRWVEDWGAVSKRGTKNYKKVIEFAKEQAIDNERDTRLLEHLIFEDGAVLPMGLALTSTGERLRGYKVDKDLSMFMYLAKRIQNQKDHWFHTECGYYNIDSYDMSLPDPEECETGEDWYIVNVDMHN